MKKIIFVFFVLFACLTANAKKGVYILHVVDKETSKYQDSIITVEPTVRQNLCALYVVVQNHSNERIYFEWENMKIDASHISFTDDMVFQMNTPKSDETILPHDITTKEVCQRIYPIVPLTTRNLKKGGQHKFVFQFSYRKGDKTYDKSLIYVIEFKPKKG